MPLSAGDRLGPYEILASIGAGGMGEVYKARDPRLNRDVAIKVSNAEFSERFVHEARSIAALNHPNICTLYDVVISKDAPNYLVMEYIEGTPLKGPLPLDQTLKYAAQICDALDAAHKKNITHRDLKPANILITKAGVKLLDFGLAKIGPAVKADEATITMALTGKGQILGTLLYMSPEQVNGEEADPRSDIFSFGLVLYEMLTGKRVFDGKSQASVVAAILERPAPSVSDVAPVALDRVLKRCLEKDPENRWQSARDLKAGLELVGQAPLQAIGLSPAGHGPVPQRWPWVVAGIAVVIAIMLGAVAWRSAYPPDSPLRPLVRLDVDLGAEESLTAGGFGAILSPDGARLVYRSQNRLFIRRLDQPKATELPGTEGARAPFFSPDGQWVAFAAQEKLKKISVEGGAAVALCDAPGLDGGSWGGDGSIVAALAGNGGLSRIPAAGGAPIPVTEMAQGEVTHRWPQILPGGKAVLFTALAATSGFDGANIEVMSLTDRRRKTLQRGGTYGRYLATSKGAGYLTYINNGTLFAVPFDLDTLAVRGTPSPVLEEVAYSPQNGFAQFDFSQSGTLVYQSGGAAGRKLLTVQWLDGAGRTQPLLAKPGPYVFPRLSPDGQRLALMVTAGSNPDIWIYEWQRDTMTRLTFGGFNNSPAWSPDGRYIVFEARGGMFWTRSDGAGQPQPLTQTKNRQVPYSFAPDAKRLAFFELVPGDSNIWTLPLESDGPGLRAGKPEPFLQTPFNERHPFFSPDGRWLAYDSNESGSYEVYVRAFPDKGGKWQISNGGALYPEWAHNGRELFFRALDNRIMVAGYTVKGDSFLPEKPRVWSDKQIADPGVNGINYSPSPDGKRIAALMSAEAPGQQQVQNHVIFLENFLDDLRRRVPAGK
jgi:eukaryotic-like serine/threonine-protein kinase